jgi:hypothetical protein
VFLLSFVSQLVKDLGIFASLPEVEQYKKVETLSRECYMREQHSISTGGRAYKASLLLKRTG